MDPGMVVEDTRTCQRSMVAAFRAEMSDLKGLGPGPLRGVPIATRFHQRPRAPDKIFRTGRVGHGSARLAVKNPWRDGECEGTACRRKGSASNSEAQGAIARSPA